MAKRKRKPTRMPATNGIRTHGDLQIVLAHLAHTAVSSDGFYHFEKILEPGAPPKILAKIWKPGTKTVWLVTLTLTQDGTKVTGYNKVYQTRSKPFTAPKIDLTAVYGKAFTNATP